MADFSGRRTNSIIGPNVEAGEIRLGDGAKLKFGNDADTEISFDGTNLLLDSRNATGVQIVRADGGVGFFGTAPISLPSASTTALTTITSVTATGTSDFAIRALTVTTPAGFASLDEGNAFVEVVKINQARIAEIHTALQNLGLIA